MSTKSVAKTKKGEKTRKTKKKVNLLKLHSEMNKNSIDAVDREIAKRFKVQIDASDEDITKTSLNAIIKEPKSVDLNSFHEGLQPYIKHYLFMRKREKKS